MADKEKWLRKLLDKIHMRGKLKLVATLEEAHLVLFNERERSKFHLTGKRFLLNGDRRGLHFSRRGGLLFGCY